MIFIIIIIIILILPKAVVPWISQEFNKSGETYYSIHEG